MIRTDLSLSQLAGGGIGLIHLVKNGPRVNYSAPAPESLQSQSQMSEVIEAGQRGQELLLGQHSGNLEYIDAPLPIDGMAIRFMTNLVVDNQEDKFVPSGASEIITAVRQPAHSTTVVYRRVMTAPGVFSEQGAPMRYSRRHLRGSLIKSLIENEALVSLCLTNADPIRRIRVLEAKVAQLEEDKIAKPSRTIFALGGFSLSVHRSAQ